jgi:hypothetical protein
MNTDKDLSLQPDPAIEPVKPVVPRDPYAGFDLDVRRRPGYSSQRAIEPWPNSRPEITRQPRRIPVFMHGRSNKTFPPVFGTDAPPSGLSGLMKKLAYAYPDHMVRHWLMLLASDRVDSLEHRVKKVLPVALGAVALLFAIPRARRTLLE